VSQYGRLRYLTTTLDAWTAPPGGPKIEEKGSRERRELSPSRWPKESLDARCFTVICFEFIGAPKISAFMRSISGWLGNRSIGQRVHQEN